MITELSESSFEIECDFCGITKNITGFDERGAIDEAQAQGWFIDGEEALCQECFDEVG